MQFVPAVAGFMLGIFFLLILDTITPHMHLIAYLGYIIGTDTEKNAKNKYVIVSKDTDLSLIHILNPLEYMKSQFQFAKLTKNTNSS